jgi:hypothetical protein
VFGPFGRPAHVAGSPAPAVGAAHQILPIGKMLPIRQMLLIGKMLPIGQTLLIGKMLPIGQMLLIGRMLLILPAPAVGAAPHDKMNALEREFVSSNNFFNNPLNPISSAYKRVVSYNRSKALPF